MKLDNHLSRLTLSSVSLGLVLFAAGLPCAASSLTGVGYIDLSFDSSAPIPAAAPSGPRFIWTSSMLFIGNSVGSYPFYYNSVSLLGLANGHEVVAIGGSAGEYGTAIGWGASAQGSVAIGRGSLASQYSVAIGSMSDEGNYSALAVAYSSIAIGLGAEANANSSIALGNFVSTFGDNSQTIGSSSSSYGDRSTAIGYSSTANGDDSFAAGRSVVTHAKGSVALGYYNQGNVRWDGDSVDPVNPHERDPLFTLGKGTSTQRSNALTVYRDGTVRLSKASGGISMGQFQ